MVLLTARMRQLTIFLLSFLIGTFVTTSSLANTNTPESPIVETDSAQKIYVAVLDVLKSLGKTLLEAGAKALVAGLASSLQNGLG